MPPLDGPPPSDEPPATAWCNATSRLPWLLRSCEIRCPLALRTRTMSSVVVSNVALSRWLGYRCTSIADSPCTCSPVHLFTWLGGSAFADAPGSVSVLDDFANNADVEVVNVGITLADGERWMVVEAVDHDTGAHSAKLYWRGGPQPEEQVVTDPFDLLAGAMYPAIVAWPGSALVHLTIKEDAEQEATCGSSCVGGAQLEVVRVDRDTVATATPLYADVVSGANNPTFKHGRPDLAHDVTLDEEYVCWTRSDPDDPSNDDDDLVAKAKDGSTWLDSTQVSLSVQADPTNEDHCEIDFLDDGTALSIFHRSDEGIRIALDWAGSIARYTLQDSSGYDFPSISVWHGASADNLWVVAKSATIS
jgi:hypothetical protein